MAPRNRTIARNEPVSLRRGGSATFFDSEQLHLVSLFAIAAAQGGFGIYLKQSDSGNSIRLKLYGEDDTYADTLSNQDNLIYVLADFAKQLKITPFWEELLANDAARRRQAVSDGPEGAQAPAGTAQAPAKAGRGPQAP